MYSLLKSMHICPRRHTVHYHMYGNLKDHKCLKPWENMKLLFVWVVDDKEKLKFIMAEIL